MKHVTLSAILGYSLLGIVAASAAEVRSCTDPSTQVEVKAAVQERLASLGMPQDIEALALLSRFGDARSDMSRQLGAVFQRKSGLPTSAFRLCEVADVGFDGPMFVTVLFVDPANDQPGGLVFNFGFPGAIAPFGDRLDSVQP